MAKLVFALLFAVVAVVAARHLSEAQALVTIAELPKSLQTLNARLATITSSPKASVKSLIDSYEEYEAKYVKIDYKDGQTKYAYAPAHDRSGYEEEGKREYAREEERKYYVDQHEDKYEQERAYKKHEAAEEYEPKYEKNEEAKHSYDSYESYSKEDSYAPSKVSVKLYEKYRSKIRTQETNVNTFQFTSELTCQDPKHVEEVEKDDGLIGFPIMSDRMKLVTVGVCEWTVTLVKEQRISEHAHLKGNTNVVCRFNEEAERHCKKAEDILCDGMSVSGQGLVYNFEADTFAQEEKPAAKKPAYKPAYGEQPEAAYEKPEYAKAAYAPEEQAPEEAAPVDPMDSLDVYLTLINGVINSKKASKWDNGAIQYFMGTPPTAADGGRDGTLTAKKGDPTGEYTFVFKH